MAARSPSNSSSKGQSARRASQPAPAAANAKLPRAAKTPAAKVWPSVVDDASRQATLQTRLKSPWDAIGVSYRSALPLLTVVARNQVVFEGQWDLEYQLDGKPVLLSDQWDWVAWHQDADVDFIELQQQREDGLRIERQFLLSRKHRFALLADVVADAPAARIDYCTRLRLAPGFQAQLGRETRELRCRGDDLAVRLFPLYLPQNNLQSSAGRIQIVHDQAQDLDLVEIQHTLPGTGGYLPMILDWSPDRRRVQAQWASLTVTEDSQVVPGEVAGGYRLKLGDHHLLAYHGTRPSDTGRAVLGLHTRYETLIGNFTKKGTVEQLLAIV